MATHQLHAALGLSPFVFNASFVLELRRLCQVLINKTFLYSTHIIVLYYS